MKFTLYLVLAAAAAVYALPAVRIPLSIPPFAITPANVLQPVNPAGTEIVHPGVTSGIERIKAASP